MWWRSSLQWAWREKIIKLSCHVDRLLIVHTREPRVGVPSYDNERNEQHRTGRYPACLENLGNYRDKNHIFQKGSITHITSPLTNSLFHPSTSPSPIPSPEPDRHLTPPPHNPKQNSPKSPLVPSATSCSSRFPYLRRYSAFTLSRCLGSQWKRTSRLTSSSVRSLLVSVMAWCSRRASRTGRLSTPLRMWARVSPCHGGGEELVGGDDGGR